MWKRILWGLLPFAALFVLPFMMREQEQGTNTVKSVVGTESDKLVIVSAHSKSIKSEFERAFRKYYREKHGRNVEFDWRDVGGTSDIMRFLDDRYTANFREYYQNNYPGEWDNNLASSFSDNRLNANASAKEKLSRSRFLASNVGIGIDLMWGGGSYDMNKNGEKGYAVDGKVQARHPEYFDPDIIPQEFSGEVMYDSQGRFYGSCLSSFGICYNPDRYDEMKLPPPESWDDLGKSELFGKVAIGDPTKSGSITKCYEMLIQQKMQESDDLELGWMNAMALIKKLAANSELISDGAAKIPMEVSSGNAAAGICIDYYGFSEESWCAAQSGGKRQIVYVLPKKGSSISCDPIQLLRGAPNLKAAHEFLDFVMSIEGQKLFNFNLGTPGGPVEYLPLRPPIRMDIYRDPHRQYLTNPSYNPFEASAGFIYKPELTGHVFSLIRIFIRCTMLDAINELKAAWQAINQAGGAEKVPEAYTAFCALPFSYAESKQAATALTAGTPVEIAAFRRKWTEFAQEQYSKAKTLAEAGR